MNLTPHSPIKSEILRILFQQPNEQIGLETLLQAASFIPDEVHQALDEMHRLDKRIHYPQPGVLQYLPDETTLYPHAVVARLSTRWWGKPVAAGKSLASTIDAARQWQAPNPAPGLVVTADHQTAGRGRQGNRWQSPPGKDLLLTFCAAWQDWPPAVSLLSLYITTAIAGILETLLQRPVQLKWPNDLMVDHQKLAGAIAEADQPRGLAFLSIGMNVNSMPAHWPPGVRENATSLAALTGAQWDREELLAQCGMAWEHHWDALLRDGGKAIFAEWHKRNNVTGNPVTLIYQGKPLSGFARSIDEQGRLCLIDDAGNQRRLPAESVQNLRVLARPNA